MIERENVIGLVEEWLRDHQNLFLIDVTISRENSITIEIDSDDVVTIDDCVALDRFLESKMDRDVEDYELEVGSAGLTSPLKIPRQYVKYIGEEVEVRLKNGPFVTGILKEVEEDAIVLEVERKEKQEGSKKKVIVKELVRYLYEEINQTKYLIRFK